MISIPDALVIASEYFPQGPELLAQHIGAEVRRGGLDQLDGFRISVEGRMIIRINEGVSRERQRFTLSHELAHALLGSQHSSRPTVLSMLYSGRAGEAGANQLAARLLLPERHLRRLVHSLPIGKESLERISQRARVSSIMTAYHLANTAREIGLHNGAVVLVEDDKKPVLWSPTLQISDEVMAQLRATARRSRSGVHRIAYGREEIMTVACLPNPDLPALFIQVLPKDIAGQDTWDDTLAELAAWLFGADTHLRNALNGQISAFSQRVRATSLTEAVSQFKDDYQGRWSGQAAARLCLPKGQLYLRMRLADWYEEA